MGNIAIAKETLAVIKAGAYSYEGRTVRLPENDPAAVEVISPEAGAALLEAPLPEAGAPCTITVTTDDSISAALKLRHPLVMNFANAHHAGGGFMLGANAQEEAICRCSTLFASITSQAAREMYGYNNTHLSAVESDYMLFSPEVTVFRDGACNFLPETAQISVMTVPAPNRRGAAVFASAGKIGEAMYRRISIMLRFAAQRGIRELVLGAWGCGAFGNDPQAVSGHFRRALLEDGLGAYFDTVVFAIYGKPDSKNYLAFKKTFG